MTSSNLTPRPSRNETALACSIIFFSLALLSFLLNWADGVRHGQTYFHIPETGGWLVVAGILGALGVICLVWSRGAKRR
jgi:uncharacterized membrane protein YsdA (DUF1294 family)